MNEKFYEKRKFAFSEDLFSRGFNFANWAKIREIRENFSSRKFVHFKVSDLFCFHCPVLILLES